MEHRKIIFLTNSSSTPFLSSDQPVINTFSADTSDTDTVEEVELFYPLTPRLAILVTKDATYSGGVSEVPLLEDAVKRYNNMIEKEAFEFVYSNSAF